MGLLWTGPLLLSRDFSYASSQRKPKLKEKKKKPNNNNSSITVIGKMQTTTTVRNHVTPIKKIIAVEDVEKLEPSSIAGM